jgi:hypothetical protein
MGKSFFRPFMVNLPDVGAMPATVAGHGGGMAWFWWTAG